MRLMTIMMMMGCCVHLTNIDRPTQILHVRNPFNLRAFECGGGVSLAPDIPGGFQHKSPNVRVRSPH